MKEFQQISKRMSKREIIRILNHKKKCLKGILQIEEAGQEDMIVLEKREAEKEMLET